MCSTSAIQEFRTHCNCNNARMSKKSKASQTSITHQEILETSQADNEIPMVLFDLNSSRHFLYNLNWEMSVIQQYKSHMILTIIKCAKGMPQCCHSHLGQCTDDSSKFIRYHNYTYNNGIEPPKRGHCAVYLDNCIIIFGGKVTSSLSVSTRVIWSYNLYTEEWGKYVIQETEDVPESLFNAIAVAIIGTIYTFGGFNTKYSTRNKLWTLRRTKRGHFTWSYI